MTRHHEEPGTRAGSIFVGRECELAELNGKLDDVLAGRGRVVLLVGEPGIGKTRLADELAQLAVTRGVRVAWGRCWDGGGAPAFWPWVQALRACTCDVDLMAADPLVRNALPDLARLLPEIVPATQRADAAGLDSEQARFRLFDSTTVLFKHLAMQTPLVLLLDDLHAADEPSLHLLRFLAREIADARIFVLGTYREAEVRRSTVLSALLGEVARASQRIHLHGLSAAEVARFIERAAGQAPSLPLVSAVHRITEGNPFFVDEIVRLLVHEERLRHTDAEVPTFRIPDEVREAIRRRLDPLGADARLILSVAAVNGREFDERVVERVVADQQTLPVFSLLRAAVAAGVISELPGALGRYTFFHELIVDTLYNDLGPSERARWHRVTGEVLERLYAANIDPHLAEIAHHFGQAARAEDADQAIDYAARAGKRASRLLAFEEAANWYERALALIDASGASDEVRCRQLIVLGEAHRRAGNFAKLETTFQRAVQLARALGNGELLARAAVGFGRAAAETGIVNQSLVGWLEEALARLPDRDDALRAAVLGRLGEALYFAPDAARREHVSQQAVDMARRLDDPSTLTVALMTRHFALWAPGHAAERLDIATELMRIGEGNGDPDARLDGRLWRIVDLLELGDLPSALVDIETFARLAGELRQPRDQWLAASLRAMAALLAGGFEDGLQFAQHALRLGQRAEAQNAAPFFLVQQFVHHRARGQLAAIETAVRGCADQFPALPIWRCGLALLYSELGRADEARQEFERLAGADFGALPRDGNWLAAMCLLADVCADLGDAPRARTLYDLLHPHARLNVVIAMGTACYGSVAYYLGLLAAVVQRTEAAARYFEAAITMNTQLGAPAFTAYTQYAYARLLLQSVRKKRAPTRNMPTPVHAEALLREALVTTRRFGLTQLEAKINALTAAAPGGAGPADAAEDAAVAFSKEGEYWTVAYGSNVVRLRDTKGLHYIAWLVRHPGREFHAAHLQGVNRAASTGGNGRLHVGDAGSILDPRAQSAYTRRVRDLENELEEARQANDLGRVEHVRQEIDFLARELAAAAGLGGRNRKAGSYAERARVNVTRAIGATLRRIRTADASLARHLALRIKTGNFCVYRPEA